MTDQHGELDAALERVIEAARHHLAAVRAAQGRVDDDDVWQAYVALNNASFAYDERLLDAFGEVTPWDVDSIDPDEADERFGGVDGAEASDPHPRVISVRQRRDYRVPSVAALLRVAEAARREGTPEDDEPAPVEGVGEAVLELLQSGDGSLGALDVPELEPLDGVVMVSEVGTPVDLESFDDDDAVGPFQPAADDRLVGRLDEHPFLELDDDHDHAGHQH
ncbi:hypothetical protein ABZ356_21110 [Micromonospora zamorensis]|jgi:hypothetical protein|uniref:Uncharacterized protein n=2 Tax=Micromonospora TaxID=1873 RepID=A0A7Y9WYJ7_9ACTN|nr:MULTISPECIES: hypothetical protein [Micromonospora]MBQ0981297.1 hypothetical protein [Micromonospora sp. M61]MBQ1039263.1 hypothetical protein [Micromonospora sp. C81]NYH40868.1 hypothetical protein [Micromonospora jinlongensis]TQJ22451.1 hypothetical protein FBZ33_2704 [Micromonospora sp. A202]WFE54294.1 hypothetical protein O7617_29880 [Micromonospora sp. WMMD1155]